MSEGNFRDLMDSVWRLGETDKLAAITLLEGARNHESFYPWGAHALMANYSAIGRDEDARPVAAEIGKRCPDFVPSWWPQIKLSRGTRCYNNVCERILGYARKPEMNITKEMVVPLVESLLVERPADFREILARYVENELINSTDAENAAKIVHFLANVDQNIETLGHEVKYDSWTFGLSSGGSAVISKGSVAVVNLSRLGVQGLEGWNPGLAERLTVATSALMRWAPYSDDRGVSSWSTISEQDRFAAAFWRLAIAPIEWLTLKPIDDLATPTSESSPRYDAFISRAQISSMVMVGYLSGRATSRYGLCGAPFMICPVP